MNRLALPLSGALALALTLLAPSTALAAEVMCSNDFGECTVSNDGQSWVSCTCADESSTGGTGGDEYVGLSEDELMAICLQELAWCDNNGGDGDGDGTGTSTGTGGETEGGSSTSDTDGTSSTSDTGDTEGSSTSDTGDTEGSSSTGDTGETSSTGGDTGDTGGSTTGDTDTTGGDSGSDEGGDTDSAGDTDGMGESGGAGGESGGADDQAQGCAVTHEYSGLGLLALSMLGLIGLRRRED